MAPEPLTLREREEVRVGIERGDSNSAIARRLGRHRSTIGREITRNGGRNTYRAASAQTRAERCRARPKTPLLTSAPVLAAHVTARLKAKDSPMTISIELARGVHDICGQISHETIYQAIYAHGRGGLQRGLHIGLQRRRRCRKHRRRPGDQPTGKSGPLGDFTLIHQRPAAAADRSEIGHLEGDLIVGSYNRSAIVTIFDRPSRHVWLADFPHRHDAHETLAAVGEILERIPEHARRTLTWDQGREMACHHDLSVLYGIDVYFADPHSPWQRPTNENGNALIRRYVGKGTNLAAYNAEHLRAIEHRINTIPRRSLKWSTAHQIYTHHVAMTD